GRRAMPEQKRPPGTHVVDVGVSVGVDNARALAAFDESRNAAHAAKGANGGIHTARNHLLGARKPSFRTLGFHQEETRECPGITRSRKNCMNTSCSVPFRFFMTRSRRLKYGCVPA